MKTLEQVIVDCKEEIKDCQIDLDGITELLEKHPERKEAFAYNIDDYKKRMNYNYQLAAWRRELVERRKAPEIITCGECKHRDPEDKKCDCGHDIIWQLPRDDDWFCADAERRTDGQG